MAAYHAPKRVALACKRMRSGFSVLKFCMRTFSGYLFRNRQARRRKLHIACGDFFYKSHRRAHAAAPPFHKNSRSVRLFACKRPLNSSQSLPTFCKDSSTQIPFLNSQKKPLSCGLATLSQALDRLYRALRQKRPFGRPRTFLLALS